MSLSGEDTLRLRVLLANHPLAIRIDESSMTLYGLLDEGEVTVKLNPDGNDDAYLKRVRALLSEHALGSPGGYPLYLQRWTRMGQMRDDSLQQLLLLGDPTAVFAVVCAGGLTDEIAGRAWWAVEEAENARRMLQTEAVVRGETGPLLARYLVDYLPFESDPEVMVQSVSAVLQPGLLGPDQREALWRKAQRKTAYLLGFVAVLPDQLPGDRAERADLAGLRAPLDVLADQDNPYAQLLLRALEGSGQAFVATCLQIIERPPNQEVVIGLLAVLRHYFERLRPEGDPDQPLEQLQADALTITESSASAAVAATAVPALLPAVQAMRLLSGGGYGLLRPVLRDSDAVGSLMRRKLEPVLGPVRQQLRCLLEPTAP